MEKPRHPVSGIDYPGTFQEFDKWFSSENACLDYIAKLRWPKGFICPSCGINTDKPSLMERGLFLCRECKRQTSITAGTLFHGSHKPLRTWFLAMWFVTSQKHGANALGLQRVPGLGSYNTAWNWLHKLRRAMVRHGRDQLSGAIEVDETYVGGKPRYKGQSKRGRGTKKVPVLTLVERNGGVRTRVICDVNSKTLKGAIRKNIDTNAKIMTDDNPSYNGIGEEFCGGHESVNHSAREYARNDGANINTAESYFAVMKRGVYGTFHHVSTKHLPRYCDEFDFRWNYRNIDDGERTIAALAMVKGKRLSYA